MPLLRRLWQKWKTDIHSSVLSSSFTTLVLLRRMDQLKAKKSKVEALNCITYLIIGCFAFRINHLIIHFLPLWTNLRIEQSRPSMSTLRSEHNSQSESACKHFCSVVRISESCITSYDEVFVEICGHLNTCYEQTYGKHFWVKGCRFCVFPDIGFSGKIGENATTCVCNEPSP